MKKILFFVALAISFGACKDAGIPLYEQQEQAINFWVPPTPGLIAVYPDALKTEYAAYDPGSVELKMLAFAPAADVNFEIGVEIMGFAPLTDMPVRLKVDEELSDERIVATFADYRIAAGEGTAVLPVDVDMAGLPGGEKGNLVLVFDYDNMDFVTGVIQRKIYTIEFTKKAGTPMPTDPIGFGTNPMMVETFWNMDFDVYGAYSLVKLQFIAAVLGTTSLFDYSALIPGWMGGSPARFAAALEEYKALNAEDPVNYPPLYQSGETWISFP